MKHILLIFCLSISCSLFAQKKIKNSVVLSKNDTVSINDAIILRKGSAQDAVFSFVRTRSDYNVSSQYENTQQDILYFKEIDSICYAYTFSFVVDLEKALKSDEIQLVSRKKDKVSPVKINKKPNIDKKEKKVYKTHIVHKSEVKKIFAYPIDNLTNLDINDTISLQILKDDPNLLCTTNMRYCLRKYHHIRRNGRYFALSGLVCSLGSVFINNTTARFVGTGVGGGLLLTGGVLSLVAEKWMKYSTIKPVLENDRVGLSITF